LSSIFIKRCASHWCKCKHWGRWLRLESCIFLWILPHMLEWHYLYCSWDTTKDLWPWYQLVGLLPLCHSMGHSLDKLELL
jgi:hypothetical protein